jgi:hypothetical protein
LVGVRLEEKITNLTFASSILHLEASLITQDHRADEFTREGRISRRESHLYPGGAPDFGLPSPDKPAESQPLEMFSPATFLMR